MASSSQKVNMPSVETKPNNVFVSHPTPGEGHPVPFGMYIQPATILIGDVIVSGHKVVTKEESGLADQANLLVGDLLVALDDIFIDQKPLEDVLDLFKTRSPKFSMTVIRQDRPEAEGALKYKSLKIAIELGVDKSNKVEVISSSSEPEDLYHIKERLTSMKVWQELNNLTKYIKATSNTTVAMQTWTEQSQEDQSYLFDLYVYNSVNEGPTAITFYNTKYHASITVSEPEADGKISLEASDAEPLSGFVKPTYNFFANMSTGKSDEFGFESILIANNYMTSEDNDSLVLKTQPVEPKDLPMASRYFMTKYEYDEKMKSEDQEETTCVWCRCWNVNR